jgi:pimeloyl-ACP methyl ester carboxylesterase
MNEINIKGLRISYLIEGTGHPLVLLHGALSDSRVWRKQLNFLSNEYTVVAWDAPGCGRSSDPPDDLRLTDYAEILGTFLNAIDIRNPHADKSNSPSLNRITLHPSSGMFC